MSLMEKGLGARSVNRKISTLKSFYRFLMKNGQLDKNPMQKVVAPKIGKKLPVFLNEESMELTRDRDLYGIGYEGMRDWLIIDLLYSTGMRRSELLRLKPSDLDFYNRQLKVLGKGNKERLLPFNGELATQMKEFLTLRQQTFGADAADFLLLNSRGKPLQARQLYQIVHQLLSKVSTADRKSPHVLRHTFATHLLNHGADINAIKELLGHASLAATQVYTHNTIEKLKDIYQQAHPKAKT